MQLRSDVTADYPIALSFNNNGQLTYVAHNYSNSTISVSFSDGLNLCGPYDMATNRGSDITGNISSDFYQAHENGNITLYVESDNQNTTRVEFYDGSILLGEDNSHPYEFTAQNLSLGFMTLWESFFGMEFGLTNVIDIQVGEQVPYENNLVSIPGTIETEI